MAGIYMVGAEERIGNSPITTLYELLDWHAIDRQLKGLYKRDSSVQGGGPTPYDRLSMFKAILLGQWHGLSDAELEHSLKVRLDFMVFTGFELGFDVPDESTLGRFRNRLIQAGLDEVLFAEINRQLEAAGLKVNATKGAIVDATIVPSAARPRKHLEMDDIGEPQVIDSVDRDARWVKKGNDAYFGYRSYHVVDVEDGMIHHSETHPANESETKKLPELLNTLPEHCESLLADKGFASSANRQHLDDRDLADYIQIKGHYRKPLTFLEREVNRWIGRLRFKVEQGFGTLKRRFHMSRARYMGLRKVEAQMRFAAMGFNLLKAQRKLERCP